MEILYVLIGGVLVVAGFMLAKYEPGMFKKSQTQETVFVEPEEKDKKSSKASMEEQLAAMQEYDPLKAVKKGAFEDED